MIFNYVFSKFACAQKVYVGFPRSGHLYDPNKYTLYYYVMLLPSTRVIKLEDSKTLQGLLWFHITLYYIVLLSVLNNDVHF